jgi:hypothetical protein
MTLYDHLNPHWNAPDHLKHLGWIAFAITPAIGGPIVFRRQYNSGAMYITEARLDTSKPYPRRGEEPPIAGAYEQTDRTHALAHETMRRGFPPVA